MLTHTRTATLGLWAAFSLASPMAGNTGTSSAQLVQLEQPTATYSQQFSGRWTVDYAIDSNLSTGWAVQHADGYGAPETAVFQTVDDVSFPNGTLLTFRLATSYANPEGHNLGRFRLSITSDSRGEFADGRMDEGDVTANWEVLVPLTYQAEAAVVTRLEDNSLLASGTNAPAEVYTVTAFTISRRVTGVRLEALPHDSLPNGGPGRSPNGNFVLVDFSVSAQPGPLDLRVSIRVPTVDICWPGDPTRVYQVQYSSALTASPDPLWVNLGLPVPGNGTNCVTDTVREAERRYYRVIRVQ
jgi:hypothetical protein